MKLFALILLISSPFALNAGRGCCSHHGGQSSCDQNSGYWICRDGTRSPSCMCATPKKQKAKPKPKPNSSASAASAPAH